MTAHADFTQGTVRGNGAIERRLHSAMCSRVDRSTTLINPEALKPVDRDLHAVRAWADAERWCQRSRGTVRAVDSRGV